MARRRCLAKGAEADVYEGRLAGMPAIFKTRNQKAYRVGGLDKEIRESRTRKEARLLHAAKEAGARCPVVLSVGKHEIAMSRVRGRLMRGMGVSTMARICPEVGRLLASLHSAGICHGDFTPAN